MPEYIDVPKFHTPLRVEGKVITDDAEVERYSHSWRLCRGCRYVLCSCGSCHSEECRQACGYDQQAEGGQS